MQLKHTVIIAATLLATAAIAAPSIAGACGSYGDMPTQAELDQRAVQRTVARHLQAVRTGDARQLTAMWSSAGKTGAVVRVAPAGNRIVSITPIHRAIAGWARTPDARMNWTTPRVTLRGERATVRVTIHWHGTELDETLSLVKRDGAWQLAGKRYRIVAQPRQPVAAASAY